MPLGKWGLLLWSILGYVTIPAMMIGMGPVQLAKNSRLGLLALLPTRMKL